MVERERGRREWLGKLDATVPDHERYSTAVRNRRRSRDRKVSGAIETFGQVFFAAIVVSICYYIAQALFGF